jgi:predicted dehydrogenase
MSPTLGSLPRLALIGVSGYGIVYLHLVRDALRRKIITLNAAVIINPQEVPDIVAELQAGGTTIYNDTETFFAREVGRINLCLIPVGIPWHARLTIAALHAGMNVLVEKPLAGSLADITAIRRAEAASKRWVAVGFQDLYMQQARWLKSRLLDGAIGKLESIRVIGLWPRNRAYFSRNHWAGRIAADGAAVLDSPLNNAFAHFVNLALFFTGPAAGESGDVQLESVELYRAHRIETFDTAIVGGRTAAGTELWFGVSHATTTAREPEIHLEGSLGRAEWSDDGRRIVIESEGRRQVIPLPSKEECRAIMFAEVIDRLRNPSAFICTTGIAEKHTRLIEAVHQSGEVVEFPADSVEWIADLANGSEFAQARGLAENMDKMLRRTDRLPKRSSSSVLA